MKRHGLFGKTLRDQRGMTIGMSVGGLALAIGMIALYPQVASQFEEVDSAIYDIFTGGASIATPEGFIAAEFFGWIPIVIIVIAVIAGTGSIAGEESNGTLELLLSEPISRRSVLLRKTAGLALSLAVICVVSYVGLIIGTMLFDEFDVGFVELAGASVMMLLIVWFFLGLSILSSTTFPSRRAASVIVTALIVVAYLVNVVATLIEDWSFLEYVTPFGWADYTAILQGDTAWVGAALLAGFTVLFVVGAVIAFERRDLGATQWPSLFRSDPQPEPGEQTTEQQKAS